MNRRAYKNTRQLILGVLVVVMMFLTISCSTYLTINLDKSYILPSPKTETTTIKSVQKYSTAASINVRIDIAEFLVSYFEDLLGIDGVQGLVEILELEEYLNSQADISNVSVLAQVNDMENKDSISIMFQTLDLLETLDFLGISYTVVDIGQESKISLTITREFVKNLLNNFSQVRDAGLVSALMPDEAFVKKEGYAEYVSWSFSDYAKETFIQSELDASVILVGIQKKVDRLSASVDREWAPSKKLEGYQEKEVILNFIDTLYDEKGVELDFILGKNS